MVLCSENIFILFYSLLIFIFIFIFSYAFFVYRFIFSILVKMTVSVIGYQFP